MIGWTINDIEINGARLHYYRAGSPGQPALVLVHGFSDNGPCWEELVAGLDGKYDIFLPEMRGHGQSTRLQPGAKFDMVADLETFIRTLGLEKPVIGGHSMGASVTSHLAARCPDLPQALLLEDPPWFEAMPEHFQENKERPSPFALMVECWQRQTLDEILSQCRHEHPNWAEPTARHWCAGKKQLDPNFISTNNMPNSYWKDAVGKITCPTLLITADPEQGGIVTPLMASQALALNPQFHLAHIPGVGHHVRFGNFELYLQQVKAFLQEYAATEPERLAAPG